jgi:hypothetical protein
MRAQSRSHLAVGQLRPDFKTIADFRKDNTAAFKQAAREFTRLSAIGFV